MIAKQIAALMLICLFAPQVFASVAVASSEKWQALSGCYQTIEFDGAPVDTAMRSRISVSDDSTFSDPKTQKPIPSLHFLLYQGRSQPSGAYILSAFELFLDRGSFSESENELHYTFDGYVATQDEPVQVYRLGLHFTAIIEASGMMRLKTIIRVDDSPRAAIDEYVLKPITCSR